MDPRGTRRAACGRDRGRRELPPEFRAAGGDRGDPPFQPGPGGVTSSRRPRASSLQPPPSPPRSAATAAGKGAEATASLPLPTTQAQQRPTVWTRATSVRTARAPRVTSATRRGGGATASRRGHTVRPAHSQPTSDSGPRPPVATLRLARRSCPPHGLLLPPEPGRQATWWGPRAAGGRPRRAASGPVLSPRRPPDAMHAPHGWPRAAPPRAPREARLAAVCFSRPPAGSRDPQSFPEDTWEAGSGGVTGQSDPRSLSCQNQATSLQVTECYQAFPSLFGIFLKCENLISKYCLLLV